MTLWLDMLYNPIILIADNTHNLFELIYNSIIVDQEKMKTFKPELVIISAGFDSRLGDPLGNFTLTDKNFATLTKILMDIAGEFAAGRLVSVLEGGYCEAGLALAVKHHIEALRRAS